MIEVLSVTLKPVREHPTFKELAWDKSQGDEFFKTTHEIPQGIEYRIVLVVRTDQPLRALRYHQIAKRGGVTVNTIDQAMEGKSGEEIEVATAVLKVPEGFIARAGNNYATTTISADDKELRKYMTDTS